MSTLWRFTWRVLATAKLRAVIIGVILTLQAAGLSGALIAQRSMLFTRTHYSETLRLADLEVQIGASSPDELPMEALRAVPGVADVSARFVALRQLDRADEPPLPVLIRYMDLHASPVVNGVTVLEGAPLDDARPGDVLVDRSFAEAHALRIGDELVLDAHRVPERIRVAGIGLSPEHLVSTANPEQMIPDHGSLGVVYASRALIDARFPERLSNDLCFRFAPGADHEATTRLVLLALRGVEIERVTPRAASFGDRYLDVMLGGARVMAPVTALLTSLLAAIVACIAAHRTSTERRREIGCLLALGFRPREVAVVFFAVGFVPATVATVVGAPTSLLFGRILAHTSAQVAGFPEPLLSWTFSDLAIGGALSLVVGVIASLIPALAVARITPSVAMARTGEAQFAGVPRVFRVFIRGSAPMRYALRNVFRRPRLAAVTLALVALAMCMPAGLLTSLSSWRAWAEHDATRQDWDAVVTFTARLTDDEAREVVARSAESEPYVQGYATLERAAIPAEQVRVRGVDAHTRLAPIKLVAGRSFVSNEGDEIVLNAGFLQGRRPPQVGERVTLERRGERRTFVVVGLVADAGLATAYVPRGTAQDMFGKRNSGVYVRFSERDGESAVSALRITELVASVQTKTEQGVATDRYLSSFHTVLWPFVGLSAIVALAFLGGVVSFLVSEREPEYAVLRALGHEPGDVARLIAIEVLVVASAGVAASGLAWAAASWALRAAMARAWFHVPIHFRAFDWLIVLVPTAVAILASLVPALRSVRKLSLAGALGPRAIG
jgi:putative ABC transport system permease protein